MPCGPTSSSWRDESNTPIRVVSPMAYCWQFYHQLNSDVVWAWLFFHRSTAPALHLACILFVGVAGNASSVEHGHLLTTFFTRRRTRRPTTAKDGRPRWTRSLFHSATYFATDRRLHDFSQLRYDVFCKYFFFNINIILNINFKIFLKHKRWRFMQIA